MQKGRRRDDGRQCGMEWTLEQSREVGVKEKAKRKEV